MTGRLEWQWFLRGRRLQNGEALQLLAQGVWLTGQFIQVNEGTIPLLCYPRAPGLGDAGDVPSPRSILLDTQTDLRRPGDTAAARLELRAAREGPVRIHECS